MYFIYKMYKINFNLYFSRITTTVYFYIALSKISLNGIYKIVSGSSKSSFCNKYIGEAKKSPALDFDNNRYKTLPSFVTDKRRAYCYI